MIFRVGHRLDRRRRLARPSLAPILAGGGPARHHSRRLKPDGVLSFGSEKLEHGVRFLGGSYGTVPLVLPNHRAWHFQPPSIACTPNRIRPAPLYCNRDPLWILGPRLVEL